MPISKKFRTFLSGLPVLVLLVFGFLLSGGSIDAHPNQDSPGQGFKSGDDCGFVMGSAVIQGSNGKGQVVFDAVPGQGCVDENGYFFADENYTSRAIYRRTAGLDAGRNYRMNFTWSNNPKNHVNVDQTTGQWSGYALLEGLPQNVSENERWVWFNWTCEEQWCSEGGYQVHTDMNTGEIAGVAWNDRYGWIAFNALDMELPPLHVDVFVDILANDTDVEPNSVTPVNAPLADGYEYWRTRAQFFDRATGAPLQNDLIKELKMDIVPTAGSFMPLNQIEMTGDGNAIIEEYNHPSIPECAIWRGYACPLQEEDGSRSYNAFISSGAPTGNAQGVTDDGYQAISYHAARFGCVGFYYDQPWGEDCSNTQNPEKNEVFYDRGPEKMRYSVNRVEITFKVASTVDRDYIFHVNGEEVNSNNGVDFAFDYEPQIDKQQLMFRPMVRVSDLNILTHDGESLDYVPDFDPSNLLDAQLVTIWEESGPSQAYKTATGKNVKYGHILYTRMDAASDLIPEGPFGYLYDYHLLILNPESVVAQYLEDFSGDGDTQSASMGLPFLLQGNDYIRETVNQDRAGGYSIQSFYQPIVYERDPKNVLSAPTVEQYVCQLLSPGRFNYQNAEFGTEACYYVSSLPVLTPYADPEPMEAVGVVKSTDALTGFFEDNPDLSVLGNTEITIMRNKMYAQLLRYLLNRDPGPGELSDGLKQTANSEGVELLGGRLIIFNGDVRIRDLGAFIDSTVVTIGGDIYVDSDISGGRLGLIALKDLNGTGGNMYVAPNVIEMNTNIFLDGTLYSYDGLTQMNGRDPHTAELWQNREDRMKILRNQLYLSGSVIAKNTIGALDGGAPFLLGDGTTTNSINLAVEYDLNRLRQFRLCYEIVDGNYDYNSKVRCNEGEYLSPYGRANDDFSSFIIEYEPPTGLPIFNSR